MGDNDQTEQMMPYERAIYIFLSLYRFFSYVLAVVLIQTRVVETTEDPDAQTYAILGVVGVYTMLKVFSPLRWQQAYPTTYVVWLGDLFLCILLLMFTDGLDSGFLLYALAPIITAALLLGEIITLSAAGLTSFSLVIVHTVVSMWDDKYVWIMEGSYLPLMVVYVICCFLIIMVAYRTNLNIRQRIEMDAILEERRRIRRELHDGVAQTLSYLNMRTRTVRDLISAQDTNQALDGIEDIQKTVKDTYEEIRQAMDSLSEREAFPLVPTLTEYVQEFGERNNVEAKFEIPKTMPRLTPMAELQLLRIAHEALTNVRKHARATKVWVKLESAPYWVEMIIRDNGRGFSFPDYEQDMASRHGLTIMKERAESLGGTFAILATPEQGTEIRVKIPVAKVRL